jgi:UDP-galactopyranose mutase
VVIGFSYIRVCYNQNTKHLLNKDDHAFFQHVRDGIPEEHYTVMRQSLVAHGLQLVA